MKLISAVIRPKYLQRLAMALRKANVPGITVLKAQGFGREQLDSDLGGIGIMADRIKIEIAIEDDETPRILKLINDIVATGRDGDGIIFVWELVQASRIKHTGTDPGI